MDPAYITSVNHALMQADVTLFGVYPPLWLQDTNNALKPVLDGMAPFLVSVYMGISMALSLVFLFLLLLRQDVFPEMCVAFILCLVIALPFWYMFPALSPTEAFYIPLFHLPITEHIQTALKTYEPNAYVLEYIRSDAAHVHEVQDSYLFITTMPSMHAAWIAVAAYYLIAVRKTFAVISIPYFFANAVSTLYIMQHYAVDQIAGLLVAVIAIVMARRMQLRPGRHLGFLFEVIRKDVEGLKGEVRRLLISHSGKLESEGA